VILASRAWRRNLWPAPQAPSRPVGKWKPLGGKGVQEETSPERAMARYKHIDTQPKFLPVDLARQLLPGTFEHAVHHLVEHEIELTPFDARFRNDETGAPAYPPALLLKVVLAAYAHGVVSSRGIERLCREHVTFIALCGDQPPHFTTIAEFVSTSGEEIARVFAAVVAICDRQGLIGREMFAIDGVKLPSNASKRKSGTRAEFERQATKLEATAHAILQRHRAADARPAEPPLGEKDRRRVERLQRDAVELRAWLARHPEERRGPKGTVRQSNRTDNESAKMATGKGVIQGYTGAAAVDAQHQIIVDAQAHGTGSEQEVLLPVVDALRERELLAAESLITADAGYHSAANLQALAEREVDALLADHAMRQRDARFASQVRHRAKPDPLYDKSRPEAPPTEPRLFQPSDFQYDPRKRTCVCPAGKSLYRSGKDIVVGHLIGERYRGAKRDCVPCPLRERCLRHPEKTQTRQVMFFTGRVPGPRRRKPRDTLTARMQARIDTPEGRAQYAARFGVVEPVFGNLCHNKGLRRFTLRGRAKVDGQWKLFCLVHNIEKLARLAYAA
jgi:transposase